jgi:threonine synthase
MARFRTEGRMPVPEHAWRRAQALFRGLALDDDATVAEIRRLHEAGGYLADPHSAIGIAAARAFTERGLPTIAMATAHPAKFPDAILRASGSRPALPARLADLYGRMERYERAPKDLAAIEAMVRAMVLRNAA